jgi:hypothetical protein
MSQQQIPRVGGTLYLPVGVLRTPNLAMSGISNHEEIAAILSRPFAESPFCIVLAAALHVLSRAPGCLFSILSHMARSKNEFQLERAVSLVKELSLFVSRS